MSDYILKKDCQKNMEDMKTKLEKEYAKKIEMEKKRGLEEQKKYEEKIEIKNRKENMKNKYLNFSTRIKYNYWNKSLDR